MRVDCFRRNRLRRLLFAGSALIALLSPGCGRSGVVEGELSEAARKSLLQRKMDLKDKPTGKPAVGKQVTKAAARPAP
jgi:hypothetical protein